MRHNNSCTFNDGLLLLIVSKGTLTATRAATLLVISAVVATQATAPAVPAADEVPGGEVVVVTSN